MPAADRERRSALAIGRLLDLPEVAGARAVMAFWSFGSEIDTAPLVAALVERGIPVAMPRIDGGDLVPVAYRPGDPTAPTSFGAREPTGADVLDAGSIDVVVVPGLAFDRGGRRVGYGGGFYDRFLRDAARDAFRVGLAFSTQLTEDDLPAGPWDEPLDALATDREVVRCTARRT